MAARCSSIAEPTRMGRKLRTSNSHRLPAVTLSLAATLVAGAAGAQQDQAHSARPDFLGIRARANVADSLDSWIDAKTFPRARYGSMFFPVPGDPDGKPVAFLAGNNADEVVGDDNSPIL